MKNITMDTCRYARFRASEKASANVPLSARSVGHHTVSARWHDHIFKVEHVVFIWGITGTGIMVIDGSPLEIPSECIGIYMPGMLQEIYASDSDWEYCWWTLDGPQAETMVKGFGFNAGVYPTGPAPVALIKQLDDAIQRPGRNGEIEAAAIAYDLLSLAGKYSMPRKTADHHDERLINDAVSMIMSSWHDPAFGVDAVASALGIHRSTISRRFHDATGTSMISYIMSIRMHNAMHMLKHSSTSIAEISRQCGYTDPNYFSRLMKTKLGISPSELRKRS